MTDSTSLSIFENQGLSVAQTAFCDMLADCVSVQAACEASGWTRGIYRRMCATQPAFDTAVARAREHAQDALVDATHDIAANGKDVNRDRLRIETIKWTASKIRPRVYGDKLDITLEHRLDIGDALATARARASLRPMCDPLPTIEGECEALTGVAIDGSIDKQSMSPLAQALPDIFS